MPDMFLLVIAAFMLEKALYLLLIYIINIVHILPYLSYSDTPVAAKLSDNPVLLCSLKNIRTTPC